MTITLAQLEKQINQQNTDPLRPEVLLVYAQVEHYPGVREGGALEEFLVPVKNRIGSIGDRLRAWVLSEFGSDARLSAWETVPTSRQIRVEAEFNEF